MRAQHTHTSRITSRGRASSGERVETPVVCHRVVRARRSFDASQTSLSTRLVDSIRFVRSLKSRRVVPTNERPNDRSRARHSFIHSFIDSRSIHQIRIETRSSFAKRASRPSCAGTEDADERRRRRRRRTGAMSRSSDSRRRRRRDRRRRGTPRRRQSWGR